MSVALVVTCEANEDENRYVPLATQDSFVRYWLPTARNLALRWIPKFESGTVVPAPAIPQVVDELQRIAAFLDTPGHQLPVAEAQQMRQRVDRIASALREVADEPGREIFIG